MRTALVVAHPGHELRTFGWYETARPSLFVLTGGDGGCGDDQSRLLFSRALAAEVGAPTGALFGRFRDREVYAAILARDAAPFVAWADALATELIALEPELVVVDSWQMYNVSHDLLHVLARLAVEQAIRRLGRPIRVAEYDPAPAASGAALPRGGDASRIELDDAAFSRKQAAALRFDGLAGEVSAVLGVEGLEAQRTELHRNSLDFACLMPSPGLVPPYERFGAKRVAAGRYRECILWAEHLEPIVRTILGPRL